METELHAAARANDADRVARLIREGARIEARDKAQRTALLVATRANAVDAARVLIEAGALMTDGDGGATRKERLPGMGNARCFRILPAIWGADHA